MKLFIPYTSEVAFTLIKNASTFVVAAVEVQQEIHLVVLPNIVLDNMGPQSQEGQKPLLVQVVHYDSDWAGLSGLEPWR